MFAVIPTCTASLLVREEVLWCETYKEALDDAEQQTAETGRSHTVLEAVFVTEEPAPVPLHEQYGVIPGVDFPATL